MSTDLTLIEAIQQDFPNAEPNMAGREDPDSAIIPWGGDIGDLDAVDLVLVVTRWEDEDHYDLGLYPGRSWYDAEALEGAAMIQIPAGDISRVCRVVDFLLTAVPEDVDHVAWANHWMTDIYDPATSLLSLPVEVIHDPVDGFVAVIHCPSCDGAFGVQSDPDLLVARDHLTACGVSGEPVGMSEARADVARLKGA